LECGGDIFFQEITFKILVMLSYFILYLFKYYIIFQYNKTMKRRKFIALAPALAASLPLIMQSCSVKGAAGANGIKTAPTINEFGLQLWTVRNDMAADPQGTLKALSSYGFNTIESFQHDKLGMFWGMRNLEFSEFLKDINLKMISSHVDPQFALDAKLTDKFKKVADESAEIGVKYLINPYLGFLKTNDDFKRATDGFNKCGEICKERGLKYAYHNHHYSFIAKDGVYPQDIMMKGSDANLVDFEMDIYWVVTAKQDPIAWLEKYPNRFKLCHVKDRHKANRVAEIEKVEEANPDFGLNVSCVLGQGQIQFDKILQFAKDKGMEHFIVEQERYDNSTPMKDAEKDASFMRQYKNQG
jgi:sugar phosphate isomerase/epimerase